MIIECILEFYGEDNYFKRKINMNGDKTLYDLKKYVNQCYPYSLDEIKIFYQKSEIYPYDKRLNDLANTNVLPLVFIIDYNNRGEDIKKEFSTLKPNRYESSIQNEDLPSKPKDKEILGKNPNYKTLDKANFCSMFKNKVNYLRNISLKSLQKPEKNTNFKSDGLFHMHQELFSIAASEMPLKLNIIQNVNQVMYSGDSNSRIKRPLENIDKSIYLKKKKIRNNNIEKEVSEISKDEDNFSCLSDLALNENRFDFFSPCNNDNHSIINDSNMELYKYENCSEIKHTNIETNNFFSSINDNNISDNNCMEIPIIIQQINNEIIINEEIKIDDPIITKDKITDKRKYLFDEESKNNKKSCDTLIQNNQKILLKVPQKIKSDVKSLNIIFDLDETLIFAEKLDNFAENIITVNFDKQKQFFKPHIRKGTIELLRYFDKYCNFFVVTNGIQNYADEVIKFLNKSAKINIIDENVSAADNKFSGSSYRPLKNLDKFGDKIKNGNYIILDDNIKAWDTKYLNNIIISQKFNIKENSDTWILFLSKDIDKINNVDIKYKHIYPYIFELQSSNSFQLLHLQAIIEKVLSSLRNGVSPADELNYIRTKIFDCFIFYLDFINFFPDEEKLLRKMIEFLGGKVVEKIYKKTILTHIITNRNRNNNQKYLFNENAKFYVNVKWLFHCYFYLIKMDENKEEYKKIE